jgi:Mn-containing catalase
MDDKLKTQQPTKSPEELDTEQRMKMAQIAQYMHAVHAEQRMKMAQIAQYMHALRQAKEQEEKHKLRIDNTRKKVLSDDYMDDADKYMRLANQPTEEEMSDEAFERGEEEAYMRSPEAKAEQVKKARIEALKMIRDRSY